MPYQRDMSLHAAKTQLKEWHKARQIDYDHWHTLHSHLYGGDEVKQETARTEIELMVAGGKLLKFLRENYTTHRVSALSLSDQEVIEDWEFYDVTKGTHLHRLEQIKSKLETYYQSHVTRERAPYRPPRHRAYR